MKCKGLIGKIFGHKFKLVITDHIHNGREGKLMFAERTKGKIVCKRCGAQK